MSIRGFCAFLLRGSLGHKLIFAVGACLNVRPAFLRSAVIGRDAVGGRISVLIAVVARRPERKFFTIKMPKSPRTPSNASRSIRSPSSASPMKPSTNDEDVRTFMQRVEATMMVEPMLDKDGGQPHESRRKVVLAIPVDDPARGRAVQAYCERKFKVSVFFSQRYTTKYEAQKHRVIVFTRMWTAKVLRVALAHFTKVCPKAQPCADTLGPNVDDAVAKYAPVFVKAVIVDKSTRHVSIAGEDMYLPMQALMKAHPDVKTWWDADNYRRKFIGDEDTQHAVRSFFEDHGITVVDDDDYDDGGEDTDALSADA